MNEYIKNILPRLKRHSMQINQIEHFIERSWIKYDINDKIEYTFERDKSLIIAINGNAQTGKWNLLSTGKLHIIKPDSEELLNPEFLREDIFILSKTNLSENLQLFINEKYVTSQNFENYLEDAFKYYNKTTPLPDKPKKGNRETYLNTPISENENFDITNYPLLEEEINNINKAIKAYPTEYFKEIITSYAKNHTFQTIWKNENPKLCKVLVDGLLDVSYMEQLFSDSKHNSVFQSQLLAYINEVLG